MTNTGISKDMNQVKNNVINETFVASGIMSLPSIIALLLYFDDHTLFSLIIQIIFAVLIVLFLGLAIIRDRIPYKIKVSLFILAGYFIGIYSAVVLGFIGIACLYFAFSSIMITIHLRKKYVIMFFFFNICMLVVIGQLIYSNTLHFNNYDTTNLYSSQFWIFAIYSFAYLLSLVIRSISELNINIAQMIAKLLQENKRVENLAYFDQLTGLPNRIKFKQQLNLLITDYSKNETIFSLIILDIDNLKLINKHGSQLTGDQIIEGLASNLTNVFNDALLLARIDGDNIAFVIPYSVNDNGDKVFANIQKSCERTIENIPSINHLTCSVGMTVCPKNNISFESLVKKTEVALLLAKESGKNTYVIYDDSLGEQIEKKEIMIKALEYALEANEFELVYQPIYKSNENTIFGFEVLGRWNSKSFGYVPPDVFIPLLESSCLIVPYGYQLLNKALLQLKDWHGKGFTDLKMAVNISAIQFEDPDFYDYTIKQLKEFDLAPQYLELEITESVFIGDFNYIKSTLNKLNDFGIKLSLDDFGTGYSSLNYLRNLPIHTLKIDKSFVDGINVPGTGQILVSTLIKLAHDMKLVVIAEGIETLEQLEYLVSNQCDYLQGYYFSKPLRPEEIVSNLLR